MRFVAIFDRCLIVGMCGLDCSVISTNSFAFASSVDHCSIFSIGYLRYTSVVSVVVILLVSRKKNKIEEEKLD